VLVQFLVRELKSHRSNIVTNSINILKMGKKRAGLQGASLSLSGGLCPTERKEGPLGYLVSFSNAPQGLQCRRAPTLYSFLWRPPMSRNS